VPPSMDTASLGLPQAVRTGWNSPHAGRSPVRNPQPLSPFGAGVPMSARLPRYLEPARCTANPGVQQAMNNAPWGVGSPTSLSFGRPGMEFKFYGPKDAAILRDSSSASNLGTQHCSIIDEASASAPKLPSPNASQLQPGSPLHTQSARHRSVAFAPDVDTSDSDDRRRPEVAETMGHAKECKDVLPVELQLKALIEGQKSLQKEIHLMRTQVGTDSHELELLRQAQQPCENPSEFLQHHIDGQPYEPCNSPLAIQQEQQQQQQQQQHDLLQHYQQYEKCEENTQPVPSSALQNLGYGMDVVQVMSEHVSSHARSLKSQVDANTLRVRRASRGCC